MKVCLVLTVIDHFNGQVLVVCGRDVDADVTHPNLTLALAEAAGEDVPSSRGKIRILLLCQ